MSDIKRMLSSLSEEEIEKLKKRMAKNKNGSSKKPSAEDYSSVVRRITSIAKEIIESDEISTDESFFDMGVDSLLAEQFRKRIEEAFSISLPLVKLFQFPNIASLAGYLSPPNETVGNTASTARKEKESVVGYGSEAIAIVGMSCAVPGASDLDVFWDNLVGEKETIRHFSLEELLESGVDESLAKQHDYVKAYGYLEGIDQFDADFFDYTPRDAEMLDPQHRLFMEHTWRALEHAGYAPGCDAGAVGVFAGVNTNQYFLNLMNDQRLLSDMGELQVLLGVDKDFFATRLAHRFNFHGPAITLSTACSTSLVATHQACQSLLLGESDLCVAGGVSFRYVEKQGYVFSEGGINSPDGHCRAFDAKAEGTVFGNGLGVLVLKRLSDAERDGDTIHAVIRGSAINNDGSDKVGYTAPSVSGQAKAVAEAISVADVPAESVSYIEAHGTGTPLGDPIEIEALSQAYGAGLKKAEARCAIGSLKTNVGHLDSAAGVAGLIKTALALKHKKIPASLHYCSPNPNIDFEHSPFYVNTQLADWESEDLRRAGVSSFGVGGTNAHAILEEAPETVSEQSGKPAQLFVFSAKNSLALETAVHNAAEHFGAHPEDNLADAAYTYQVGRQAFSHRFHCVAHDHAEVVERLSGELFSSQVTPENAPHVAFLFPGEGSQFVGMGSELYAQGSEYKRCLDECAAHLLPLLDCDIRALIFGEVSDALAQLQKTQYAQPVLFSVGYALAKQWEAWGVKANGMLGHSVGEYVAATLAGVFSLEDALRLIAKRGELIASLPRGSMIAVQLPEDALRPYVATCELDIAAVNTPNKTVVSGATEAIGTLKNELSQMGIPHQQLEISHAFHSRHLAPILDAFKNAVLSCEINAPQVPFISNVTGDWVTSEEATSVEYWLRHLREPVRFSDGIKQLGKGDEEDWVFLEVGPGQSLGTFAQQSGVSGRVIASLPSQPDELGRGDYSYLLSAMGTLWESGVVIDWAGYHGSEKRQRVPLPTYPFQRQRYWIDLNKPKISNSEIKHDHSAVKVVSDNTVADGALIDPDIIARLANICQSLIGIEKLDINKNFFDLGGDSLLAVQFGKRVEKEFSVSLPMVKLFQFPNIASLAKYLSSNNDGSRQNVSAAVRRSQERLENRHRDAIAIVGMSCSVPGASDLNVFWENLIGEKETIRHFSIEELLAAGVDESLVTQKNYVKSYGYLEDIDQFDAQFFDYSPRDAEILDPQHRLFMEHAWQALEQAGYAPGCESEMGAVGIYAGVNSNQYGFNLMNDPELLSNMGELQVLLGVDKDYFATRLAHRFNFHGPAMTVATGCSTSLVATHQACQSLLSRESDMCIAGGVSLRYVDKQGYMFTEGGISSPDGHCRAFDAEAQGTVFGSGLGVVILKRLSDAERDGDTIHAVIKGSAINNDGSDKVGYTAPSVSGQAKALTEALSMAEVPAESVSYIEAHGTGTALGDPIEIEALNQAYGPGLKSADVRCAIGSLKTNVGHLDSAAGVAGLIKATLALKYKQIPASLHFNSPNPNIDFEHSPFYVNTKLNHWEGEEPRRAGVSSFGVGGTNAHVILEEAPENESEASQKPAHLFVFSAKNSSAVEAMVKETAEYFQSNRDINLADAAYTYQMGRQAFSHRYHCVARDHAQALDMLSRDLPELQMVPDSAPQVAFLFPGQGSQFVGMGRELYEHGSEYQYHLDICANHLTPLLGCDIRPLIFGEVSDAQTLLQQTQYTQPALFSVGYALAKQWEAWGVKANGMLGHSVGEYVAATVAGVFSLEDALTLIAKRGELISRLPCGSMVAVQLSESEVRTYIESEPLDIAAVNTPNKTVVSGDENAIKTLEKKLTLSNVAHQRLSTSHAFHSRHLEPMLNDFRKAVSLCELHAPQIPFISNVSGHWITEDEAVRADYWVGHLRDAVNFRDGIKNLSAEGEWIFLEVGPGQSLGKFVQQSGVSGRVIPSLPSPRAEAQRSDYGDLLSAIGALWESGLWIDWQSFYGEEKRRRIPLPTYPFQRQRYWLEANRTYWLRKETLERKQDVAEWLYAPSWKRISSPCVRMKTEKTCWLIFKDNNGVMENLGQELAMLGHHVSYVSLGTSFCKEDNTYSIAPNELSHYQQLLETLSSENQTPEHIAHGWMIDSIDSFDQVFSLGYKSIIHLVNALGKTISSELSIFATGLLGVLESDVISPEKSIVSGLSKVIPQEYPNITGKIVDLDNNAKSLASECILANIQLKTAGSVFAVRGGRVWEATYEKIPKCFESVDRSLLPFKAEKHYVIAGGLGGIGHTLAKYLASTYACRLTLIGRAKIEGLVEWEATRGVPSKTNEKLDKIIALKNLGADVHYLQAKLADKEEITTGIERAEKIFGQVNGIIHAAGVVNVDFIETKRDEISRVTFEAKIQGLDNLISATSNVDFVVLCSSISSLVGGFGQVDYAASNAYLDARGDELSRAGVNTYVINWNAWNDTGMAVSGGDSATLGVNQEYLEKFGIDSHEAITVFERAIALAQSQTIVMPVDFNQYCQRVSDQFDHADKTESDSSHAGDRKSQPNLYDRPVLSSEYVEPDGEVEIKLSDIFKETIGLKKIGMDDSFFELGGDSLIATKIIAAINAEFSVEIVVSEFMENSTIRSLALCIKNKETDSRPQTPSIKRLSRSGSKKDHHNELEKV